MTNVPTQLSAAVTDRYRIERELGQGGMATVYLAHDVKHDRQVALKVLRPELGAVLGSERFLAEIKITARLDHPHILTLIDSGASDGLLYYVLPFVRGESLRDLLNREKQLGIEQAIAIVKQVGSALDYAHRHGVVHRDIKPENILLQEGEAMLADFGIALAVKEAGGNRLTETGLSLGTPQYMSPEQATGDRTLDARSDLYSLAAVLYEMLTGEPPMTGPTVQAVIAKLLTEQPTRIRTVRNTVPEGIDNAVAKALSKVPADRFGSPGEFVRALEAAPAPTGAIPPVTVGVNRRRAGLIAAGAVALAVLGTLAATGKFKGKENLAALRDRTQLTFTGNIAVPALSPDGKQLAFFVRDCTRGTCTYALEAQDVGGTATRRILEGITAAYGLEWSPDRRNLIVYGTIGRRYGSHLVSVLGGAPRYLTAGVATFYAGGDSLLIGPGTSNDSIYPVRVAGLDGTVRDSVLVRGKGQSLAALASIPGASRFIALIIQAPHGLWQVIDRSGKSLDHLVNSCTCGGSASRDAIWMTRAGPTAAEAVVRVAIDPGSGRFASRQDTIYNGRFTGLTVTADGAQMAVDDGSFSISVQALDVSDLLKGKFSTSTPITASSGIGAQISPDGGRLLLQRTLPGANGGSERRLSVMPFGGGSESPVNTPSGLQAAFWVDSVSLAVANQQPGGLRLAVIDIRNGAVRNAVDLPDSTIRGATVLPDGWAWIPRSADRIIVARNGKRQEIRKPEWFGQLSGLTATADGSRLAYFGWNAATSDSVRLEVVPTDGGTPVSWFQSFSESFNAQWLTGGALLAANWSGEETAGLFRLAGPGKPESLGEIPHPLTNFNASADLKRAAMRWRDYHGDAWFYKVVKPQ